MILLGVHDQQMLFFFMASRVLLNRYQQATVGRVGDMPTMPKMFSQGHKIMRLCISTLKGFYGQ